MKRIKDVALWISLSIAVLYLVLIMHVVTAHANEQFLFKFGSYGSGDGQFDAAFDVAVDSSGNIYVADYGNNRIQVFDSSGNFLHKFGSFGVGDGLFFFTRVVAVDSSGNIYVADYDNERIQVFGEIVPTPTPSPTPSLPPPQSPTPAVSPSPIPSPTEPPTAVSLASFKAKVNGDGSVTLIWETASAVDNAGFNIYRSKRTDGMYKKVNGKLIPAQGSGAFGARYRFEDTPGSGTFYYKLEDVDENGVSAMHGPVKIRLRSAEGEARRRKK